MMKKWCYLFIYALVLNFFWEILHSSLYLHYRGGPITETVLFRAALVDAFIILVLSLTNYSIRFFRTRPWLLVFFSLTVSIELERWALITGSWAYASSMPIIPIILTGLTPTIQLALLGYLSYKSAGFYKK
jgi:hypothetical protein